MDSYSASTPLDETVTGMKTRSQKRASETEIKQTIEDLHDKSKVSLPIEHDKFIDIDSVSQVCSPTELASKELETRSKLARAVLLKKELELRMQLFEAQKEVELAEIECARLNPASVDTHNIGTTSSNGLNMSTSSSRDPLKELDQLKDSIMSIAGSTSLPRLELNPFDGNPIDYLFFIKQFDNIIASKTNDNNQLLSYLIHYCQGKARRAIEACMMLPPAIGYNRARALLKDLYGQEHVIARSHMDELVKNNKPITNSSEDLTEFAAIMRNNQMSLEQLGYDSELNSTVNLERVISRLPLEMQSRWAELADNIVMSGREPTFNDLTTFVEAKARIARTRYGQLWQQNRLKRETPVKFPNPTPTRSFPDSGNETQIVRFHATNSYQKTCPLCQLQHQISECMVFLKENTTQRRNIARRFNLCYLCLKMGHGVRTCTSQNRCLKAGCTGNHHSLLHVDQTVTPKETVARVNLTRGIRGTVFYGTIPVRISGPKGVTETYAFIDAGSDTSLISEELINRVGITGDQAKLNITTLNGNIQQSSLEVEVELWALDQSNSIVLSKAYTIPKLPLERTEPSSGWNPHQWEHLQNINLQELNHNAVEVLIGSDTPMAHWALEQRWGTGNQPFAIRSHLGWRIVGPYDKTGDKHQILWCGCSKEADARNDILRLFEREFELVESNREELSIEDKRAMEIANSNHRFIGRRIEVGPPWKDVIPEVDNLPLALGRLNCLKNRLRRDPQLLDRYCKQMDNHIQKGHISKSNIERIGSRQTRWFIPHHPVLNPKKPDKLRVVFDCAAKHKGASLNDYLLQGPNTVNSLVGVLLRFRKHQTAIAADIEEMFLQVKLPIRDQRAFSLLWWSGGNLERDPDIYQLTVHPFGAVSSPFCANYALKKVVERSALPSDGLGQLVEDFFYVDDCLVSFENRDLAIQFIEKVSKALAEGGFRLTKWVSNDKNVLSSIKTEHRTPALKELNFDDIYIERTLGMKWNIASDTFIYDDNTLDKPITRRGILSTVASIFDPLGLIAPIILPAKQILQRLCTMRLRWDDKIPDKERILWCDWLNLITGIKTIEIPRCYKHPDMINIIDTHLHIFCDASENGYGAAAYIRYTDSEMKISCSLIMSKAKVAPLKTQTIPRLELAAATLGARMYDTIKRELRDNSDAVTLWTDSAIVLHYINNVKTRYQTFVANRVATIHRLTRTNCWRYVPSNINIADWTSRGITKLDARLDLWLQGPTFLSHPEDTWPKWKALNVRPGEIEVKASCMLTTVERTQGIHYLVGYYSNWLKLLKTIVWYRRFIAYMQLKFGGRTDITLRLGRIKLGELHDAELTIVRFVQNECFEKELHALKSYTGSLKKSKELSRLRRLNPTMKDNLLSVGGRLQNADPSTTSQPIILPNKGPVVDLIIRHTHETQGHIGATQLLATVRQKYWILQGGVAARRIVRKCNKCRMITPRAMTQIMAPLPSARVEIGNYPFTSVGTDFFGPFLVKRGRITEKRYGCIFTCMKIRAVHIEVVHNMSADSFLMAVMRFCGRRGYPMEIYCDNGSNIVGAQNELAAEMGHWSQDFIYERLLRLNIEWKFNPPSASHRGGVWERMIRSTRKILRAIMQERITTDECLATYMTEVERIVNDRPLTPITSDPNDLNALTPNHLLLLRSNAGSISSIVPGDPLVKRWRQINHLSHIFWKRWVREYLPLLQERSKWQDEERNIQIGDIVIILSEINERGKWPLGRVINTIEDTDHMIRTIEIKTANSTIRRDIRSICQLEAAENNTSS